MDVEFVWLIVIVSVGTSITIIKTRWLVAHRNMRTSWRDWLTLIWVNRVLLDMIASIALITLMRIRKSSALGSWASITSVSFAIFEEVCPEETNTIQRLTRMKALVLFQTYYTFTPKPRNCALTNRFVFATVLLVLGTLLSFIFLLVSQVLWDEKLQIGLATAGCDIFSFLYVVAFYTVSKRKAEAKVRRSKLKKAKNLLKILLPRCITIGGSFAALAFEKWIFRTLVSKSDCNYCIC
jgi:hypothetical protein